MFRQCLGLFQIQPNCLSHRLFLDQDRIRTMPYGADSSHQRGEIAVVHSGYQLGHPWGDRQKQYLNDVFRAQQTCEPGRVGYY